MSKIGTYQTDRSPEHPDGILRLCPHCSNDITKAVNRERSQAVVHALARVLGAYDHARNDGRVSPTHSALAEVRDMISEIVADENIWD